jgi:hypothetical protein
MWLCSNTTYRELEREDDAEGPVVPAKTITKAPICFLTSTISRKEFAIDSAFNVKYRAADSLRAD